MKKITIKFKLILNYIKYGNIKKVKSLINKFNVNSFNLDGVSPLLFAIYNYNNSCNSFEVIKVLLDNGADPNLVTINNLNESRFTLIEAILYSDVKVILTLCEYGADYSGLLRSNFIRRINKDSDQYKCLIALNERDTLNRVIS